LSWIWKIFSAGSRDCHSWDESGGQGDTNLGAKLLKPPSLC
jgi:hypothetical protein